MGQYYRIIRKYNKKAEVFNRSLKGGDYVMAKLLEHSWWGNPTCLAVSATLVDTPAKLCWVGDYAEEEECQALGFTMDLVWGEPDQSVELDPAPEGFTLDSFKFLVNHDKKQFVDLPKYKEASMMKGGWCIFPISLLTALGNGRGGGDYHKEDDLVGSWAFDTIEITNDPAKVEGFAEIEPVFRED